MKIVKNDQLLREKLMAYHFDTIFPQLEKHPFILQSFEAGEVMLDEGVEMTSLLYLVEGTMKVTASVGNGKSLLLRFNHPFAVIGDIEFIRHVPVQSQITAVTDCLCIALSFEYLRRFEMNNAAFLKSLLQHVTYKLQTNTTASRVNLLSSVDQRFASYLLSVTDSEDFAYEMQYASISEIADLLGTTHRHLNRVIKQLVEQHVIEKNRRFIHILNKEALEELAQGTRYD